jgi:hypothetical protein
MSPSTQIYLISFTWWVIKSSLTFNYWKEVCYIETFAATIFFALLLYNWVAHASPSFISPQLYTHYIFNIHSSELFSTWSHSGPYYFSHILGEWKLFMWTTSNFLFATSQMHVSSPIPPPSLYFWESISSILVLLFQSPLASFELEQHLMLFLTINFSYFT